MSLNTASTRTALLALLRYHRVLTRDQLVTKIGRSDRWIRLALRDLGGIVVCEGVGRGTRYALATDHDALGKSGSASGCASPLPEALPEALPDASGSVSGSSTKLPDVVTASLFVRNKEETAAAAAAVSSQFRMFPEAHPDALPDARDRFETVILGLLAAILARFDAPAEKTTTTAPKKTETTAIAADPERSPELLERAFEEIRTQYLETGKKIAGEARFRKKILTDLRNGNTPGEFREALEAADKRNELARAQAQRVKEEEDKRRAEADARAAKAGAPPEPDPLFEKRRQLMSRLGTGPKNGNGAH